MFRLRKRVPVIFQMTFAECGAACLAMILGYHGRKTRLAECRDLFGSGRDGISAWEILEAAETFGLDSGGFEVQAEDFNEAPLPAIAFWEMGKLILAFSSPTVADFELIF